MENENNIKNADNVKKEKAPAIFAERKSRMPYIAMSAAGFLGAGIFAVVFIVALIVGIIAGRPGAGIVPAIIAVVFLIVGIMGVRKICILNRFDIYSGIINEEKSDVVSIKTLADKTKRTYDFVEKDLKAQIRMGLFLQAHVLEDQKSLVLTEKAHTEYLMNKKSSYERQMEEQAKAQELTPECKKLLSDGEEYIKHVHECNEKIPGDEVSAKLDKMEQILTRIFGVVREHPETAGSMDKMMSYYLPTTKKLLDSYCDIDGSPSTGENIKTTKSEINSALDTLNTAYEKKLDSMYENKAWDISSDISVLNTILAQDGLSDDKITKNSKEG